jgi:hypothetical protein
MGNWIIITRLGRTGVRRGCSIWKFMMGIMDSLDGDVDLQPHVSCFFPPVRITRSRTQLIEQHRVTFFGPPPYLPSIFRPYVKIKSHPKHTESHDYSIQSKSLLEFVCLCCYFVCIVSSTPTLRVTSFFFLGRPGHLGYLGHGIQR